MTDHDKKISGVEAPVNSVPRQAGPSEGRRRLVKGALAAPAVMTLMNGRLAAASSTCAERIGLVDNVEIGRITTTAPGDYTTYVIFHGQVKKTVYVGGVEQASSIITYNDAVDELEGDLNAGFVGAGGSCLASSAI